MALGEDSETRRRYLAGLSSMAAVLGGNFLYFSTRKDRGKNESPIIIYRGGETYEGDPDDIDDELEQNSENVDSWDELIPNRCQLEHDEREWLEGRLDEYDDLDSEDFFDYVGREVRVGKIGDEIRMAVDSDYSGEFDADTHYKVEKGYNIPNAC